MNSSPFPSREKRLQYQGVSVGGSRRGNGMSHPFFLEGQTMLKIKELIASAKGCGFDAAERQGEVWLVDNKVWRAQVWNPAENAEQDRMCLKALLERGYKVQYSSVNNLLLDSYDLSAYGNSVEDSAEEFAAKALAQVGGEYQ